MKHVTRLFAVVAAITLSSALAWVGAEERITSPLLDGTDGPSVQKWVIAEIVAMAPEHLELLRVSGVDGPARTGEPFISELPEDLLHTLRDAGLDVRVQERFVQAAMSADTTNAGGTDEQSFGSSGSRSACADNVSGLNSNAVSIPDDPDACNSGQTGYARLSVDIPTSPGGVVCKVQYRTRIKHTNPGDLVVQINNNQHLLMDGFLAWNRDGGTDDGGLDDDLASNENIYFNYRETSRFNGDPVNGLWHIDVWDQCPTEVGTINFIEFRIFYGSPELRVEPSSLVFDCDESAATRSSTAPIEPTVDTSVMPVPRDKKLIDPDVVLASLRSGERMTDVIVTLEAPAQLRGATDWNDPVSLGRLQAEVTRRQDQVLAKLTKAEINVGFRYENFAGFSASVTAAGLERLLDDPMVRHIEPDRIVEPHTSEGLPLMNALTTRSTFDGAGTSIAIVDTGIDYTHARLGGGTFPNAKVKGGYDFGDNDPDPMPSHPHGTACAGIAAGKLGR